MIAGLLSYVEIKTKITSVFPFLMILAYLFYKGQPINLKLTSIFFCSMFLFDLTTTTINNYIDSRNNDQILPFNRRKSLFITYLLLTVSTALGIWLVMLTDIVVLFLGGICFAGGVLYTYGPVPISRQPWGELFSGIFYGLMIPLLLMYINMPAGYYISLNMSLETISLTLNLMPIITIFLLSVNPVCCTANIMLANNICDLEKDIMVKRYTLPFYLGKKALRLFELIYYVTYFSTFLMVLIGILHPICLVSILTVLPVRRNIKIFLSQQVKETTFLVSIMNYVLIMGAVTIAIFISGFIV